MNGVRLFGVVSVPHRGEDAAAVPGTELVPVRELGAVVRPAPYQRVEPVDGALEEYHGVVDAIALHRTIVPAPFGTVFKSPDHVARWLDTHYIALSEALLFVDGRCEARVHIATPPERTREERVGRREADRDGGRAERAERDAERADLAALAAESFRQLRRQAVAAVPLRSGDPRSILSGAFLVDRARWEEFASSIADHRRRYEGMDFTLSGPWPAYDFVRLELGA